MEYLTAKEQLLEALSAEIDFGSEEEWHRVQGLTEDELADEFSDVIEKWEAEAEQLYYAGYLPEYEEVNPYNRPYQEGWDGTDEFDSDKIGNEY